MKKYSIIIMTLLFLASMALSSCEKSEDFEEDLNSKTEQAYGDGTNGGTMS